MPEHAGRRARRHAAHGPFGYRDDHRLGEEALHFASWFMRSKYQLMGGFLGELRRAPEERDAEELRDRFCRAITHAQRVHQARGVVTFLLALGVVATAAGAIANALDVDLPQGMLERATALSGSMSVVLIAVRLLLDRYLERVDVAAIFLGMEIAASPRGQPGVTSRK